MATLALKRSTLNLSYRPNVAPSTRTDGPYTLVFAFSVNTECLFTSVGWARAMTVGTVRRVALWGKPSGSSPAEEGTLLGQVNIPSIGNGIFSSPISLYPNTEYRIGVVVGDPQTNIYNTSAPLIPAEVWGEGNTVYNTPVPSVLTILGSYTFNHTPGAANQEPVYAFTPWERVGSADLIMYIQQVFNETKTEPPEPLVTRGTQQFTITLPSAWMPANLTEWDLQYAVSLDNTQFGRWIDIGTFRSSTTADDASDEDSEPNVGGTYTHTDIPSFPIYFYKYRYRLRTEFAESDWSEAAIAGLPGLSGSISGSDITPGTVPGTALEPGSVTGGPGGHIATGTIQAINILSNTITAVQIAANTITAGQIAATTITAAQIAAGTITANQIAGNTITANQIAANTITANQIAANTITASEILANTITAGQIAANTITAVQIEANTITANEIAANTITANEIAANTITADQIAALTITAAQIASSTITAAKMAVAELSTISINMGNIQAGTITGAVIQTSLSGARVVMDSLGLRGYGLNGVTKVFEINAGSGVASFTGIANIDPLSVIPGGTIVENTLPGDRIIAASIGAVQIAAGAITTNQLAVGAVRAQNISVEFGGSNLLSNSSFEDSNLMSSWNIYQGYPDTPTVLMSAENPVGFLPREGTKVCRVERTGGDGGTYGGTTYGADSYGGTTAVGSGYGANNYGDSVYGGAPVTSINAHAGVFQTVLTHSGIYYTLAADILIPTSEAAQTVRLYIDDGLATGGYWASSEVFSVPNDGLWRRYKHTFLYAPWGSAANASGTLNVFVWMELATPGSTMYLDAVQFEPGEIATSYARRSGEILTGELGATKITPNSITTNEIFAGTILGTDIAGTTITAENIATDAIIGRTIRGDAIDGKTITGAVIQTASGAVTRIVLDSSGFQQYIGASITPSVHFKTDGTDTNVFTGEVQARGILFPQISSAELGTPPSNFSSMLWKRSTGTTYGQVVSAITGTASSFTQLVAGEWGVSKSAAIHLINDAANPRVTATADKVDGSGPVSVQIIDYDGVSDFHQKDDVIITLFTYSNSWRAYLAGATYGNAFAKRSASKWVTLQGVLDKNGGNWVPNELIMNIPAGYRPTATVLAFVGVATTGGAPQLGQITIETNGDVKLISGASANPVEKLVLTGIGYHTL